MKVPRLPISQLRRALARRSSPLDAQKSPDVETAPSVKRSPAVVAPPVAPPREETPETAPRDVVPEVAEASESTTRPKRSRVPLGTQVIIALITGLVAFLAVTQAQQRGPDALTGMRQADMVRLLDELGTRIDTLSDERETLRSEIAGLESGVTSFEAAQAAAQDLARTLEVQAGVVPVTGPGVVVTVTDPDGKVQAQALVTLVEELRNSGAEAIEVDGVRFAVNGWIVDGRDGIEVNGEDISSPYRIRAIGDAGAISVALEMPGGVLSLLRTNGATTDLRSESTVEILSVTQMPELEHAEVVLPEQ